VSEKTLCFRNAQRLEDGRLSIRLSVRWCVSTMAFLSACGWWMQGALLRDGGAEGGGTGDAPAWRHASGCRSRRFAHSPLRAFHIELAPLSFLYKQAKGVRQSLSPLRANLDPARARARARFSLARLLRRRRHDDDGGRRRRQRRVLRGAVAPVARVVLLLLVCVCVCVCVWRGLSGGAVNLPDRARTRRSIGEEEEGGERGAPAGRRRRRRPASTLALSLSLVRARAPHPQGTEDPRARDQVPPHGHPPPSPHCQRPQRPWPRNEVARRARNCGRRSPPAARALSANNNRIETDLDRPRPRAAVGRLLLGVARVGRDVARGRRRERKHRACVGAGARRASVSLSLSLSLCGATDAGGRCGIGHLRWMLRRSNELEACVSDERLRGGGRNSGRLLLLLLAAKRPGSASKQHEPRSQGHTRQNGER
jgi:hypothetical protein